MQSIDPKKSTILVTGANGQLGNCFQNVLLSYPEYHIIVLSRSAFPIEDKELGASLFEKYQPSYLVNCAAYTAVDKAETNIETANLINGTAVGNLAMLCKTYQTKLIHISTDYVFDGKAIEPYDENDPTDPINVYGASKLLGEKLALQNNSESIIIRTSWLYSNYGHNFVKTMRRLMQERKELNIVSDQVGTPTFAPDLVAAIMEIIAVLKIQPDAGAGVYHFSNSGIISWYDFAEAIKSFTGSDCFLHPIKTASYPTPAARPMYSVLSKEKIQKDFGISLKPWKTQLDYCLSLPFKD